MLSSRIIFTRVSETGCDALKPCGVRAEGRSLGCCRSRGRTICCRGFHRPGGIIPAPLDPVVAQIIPLLPLRDPAIMTPQSARHALRALAAARAAPPPPPVGGAEGIK